MSRKYGIDPRLIPSAGGVFEVEIDGALVFSKNSLDRFPENDEIFREIDARL